MDTSLPLKDKIVNVLSANDKPMHIQEISKDFLWIPESTIRWRLNENVWKLFSRIWKWLYVLKWDKWTIWLINWDARILDDKFDNNSMDLIISDHAWLDEKSHTWWNRSFANYNCFKYEQNDFDQKFKVLKEWWFLIEFLPEKNENNKLYLREIEDLAEKSWFKYFAEVNISWWNSNIWRKKKFISVAYFFTKWEALKLKIWDEKLAKDIKTSKNHLLNEIKKFLIKEYKIQDKKELIKLEYDFNNIKNIESLNNYFNTSNINITNNNKLDMLKLEYSEWNDLFKFMKDEYRIDFKKVYSEILHVEKSIFIPDDYKSEILNYIDSSDIEELTDFHTNSFRELPIEIQRNWLIDWTNDINLNSELYKDIKHKNEEKIIKYLFENWYSIHDLENSIINWDKNDYSLIENILNNFENRITNNFDFRITKKEAEYILNNPKEFSSFSFDIMCKEYWDDDDWVWIYSDDLDDWKLDSNYYTFDIYMNNNEEKNILLSYINSLNLVNTNIFDNNILRENFKKHLYLWELPQFKKIKKQKDLIDEINKFDTFPNERYEEYMVTIESFNNFNSAFDEYIEFLKKADSYKMWTKTILPEYYIWDLWDIREESQKPKNVIEDIILQTTNEWAVVLEQFARSYVWAEAIIKIWENWFGWRDYFGIELDEEAFFKNSNYIRNKYSQYKYFTIDDFLKDLPQDKINFINQSKINKNLKIVQELIEKINSSLSKNVNISIENFKIINDNKNITADNMDLANWTIILKFEMKNNKSEQNKMLDIVLNKATNKFDVINLAWIKISETDNLANWLVKMLNK